MGVPAIPQKYYQHWKDFIKKAPPGHKFGIFFNIWDRDWNIPKEGKVQALKDVCDLGLDGGELLDKLLDRQKRMAQLSGEDVFSISGKSNSPFMTGVGMEHPLEIGFAFLNPYGIPYLSAASVKGVIRKAAEELAFGIYGDKTDEWSIIDVWWLFGFEAEGAYLTGKAPIAVEVLENKACDLKDAYLNYARKVEPECLNDTVVPFIKNMLSDEKLTKQFEEHPKQFLQELANLENKALRDAVRNCGALVFWDVFPKTSNLEVDVLTPHYSEYYKGDMSPADCGQPKPIFFLTVPPNSGFNFYVQCDSAALKVFPEYLKVRWKELLEAAFEVAFTLVGFGAKTSVGYGRLENLQKPKEDVLIQKSLPETKTQTGERVTEIWENVTLSWSPGNGIITATHLNKKATTRDKSVVPEEIGKILFAKKKKRASADSVEVEAYGNAFIIVRI